MQNSQADTKKIFTKIFWRAGKRLDTQTLFKQATRLHNNYLDGGNSAGVIGF